MAEVADRVRAAFQAVTATTVTTPDDRNRPPLLDDDLGVSPPPHDRRRVVAAMATLTVLVMAAALMALAGGDSKRRSESTQVATEPGTTLVAPDTTAPAAGVDPTCGTELPRPLDLPDGYSGPKRVASSVEGQLVLEWTSATGSVTARWPADPEFRQLVGKNLAPTPDGQPNVGSSGGFETPRQPANGSYSRTDVYGLRNVPSECSTLQINVVDVDPSLVQATEGRLANRGLFVSNVPLVLASEDRNVAPTVVPCSAPAGVAVPPQRGGVVNDAGTYPTPADALEAFVESRSSLIRNRYLEIRLPDGSIAYAREQDQRPGSYVTVVHVVQTGAGWSVDRWEGSGC